MIIETERLLLRPFTWDDLPETVRLRADPDVVRYLGGTEMQTPEFIERRLKFYMDCRERYGFSMSPAIRKSDGAFTGWGGLQPLEETDEIEVGYGFGKEFWGQGYATELAAAWMRYGFESKGLARIAAVAYPENTASRHVMENLGMKYEKNAMHYGHECVFYGIAREDFKPREGFYAVHESSSAN